VPEKHPLRAIRVIVDEALKALSPTFRRLYSVFGRPSIPPEKLLRALRLQVLYTVCSERMLIEQLEYNLLFRWFVGLNMDEAVWVPTVFTKNRDRLWEGDIAEKFFQEVLTQWKVQARGRRDPFGVMAGFAAGAVEYGISLLANEAVGAAADAWAHIRN